MACGYELTTVAPTASDLRRVTDLSVLGILWNFNVCRVFEGIGPFCSLTIELSVNRFSPDLGSTKLHSTW